MLPFRRGMERIMKGVDAPIIPFTSTAFWAACSASSADAFFWKLPRRVPFPVTVSFGKPLPPTATAVEVRQSVQQLETEAFRHQKSRMEICTTASSTRAPTSWRFAMADGKTPELRYGAALVKTIFLARRLRKLWEGQKMVGLLLPPSVGGALVNYAAMMMGKVSGHFNYTASNEITASCAQQCDVKTTVTAKAFLERLPSLAVPGTTFSIETSPPIYALKKCFCSDRGLYVALLST